MYGQREAVSCGGLRYHAIRFEYDFRFYVISILLSPRALIYIHRAVDNCQSIRAAQASTADYFVQYIIC